MVEMAVGKKDSQRFELETEDFCGDKVGVISRVDNKTLRSFSVPN